MSECLREDVLQTYLDGELSEEHLESVSTHLATCSNCARLARELESENELVTAALSAEFSATVPTERLRYRIDAAIASTNEVVAGSPAAAGGRRAWVRSLAEMFVFTPRTFGYAGAMAVLLFAAVFALVYRASVPTTNTPQVASVETQPSVTTSPVTSSVAPSSSTSIVAAVPASSNTPAIQKVSAPGRSIRSQRTVPVNAAATRDTALANHVKLLPGERPYLQTIADLDSTIKTDKGRMKPALQAEYERNLAFVDRALAAARTVAKNNPNDPDAAQFMFSAYQSKVDLLNTVADARVYDKAH
jgi:anti-sigma factor RsiW